MGGCGSAAGRQTNEAAAGPGNIGNGAAFVGERVGQRVTKPAPWQMPGDNITKASLAVKRAEFFHTRTDGIVYIWQAIKVASEAMLDNDEDLCNSILGASNVLCPTETMAICYDEFGHEYRVPRFLFSNPTNMVEEARIGLIVKKQRASDRSVPITLRIQIAPRDTIFAVEVESSATVLQAKQSLQAHLKALCVSIAPVPPTPVTTAIVSKGKGNGGEEGVDCGDDDDDDQAKTEEVDSEEEEIDESEAPPPPPPVELSNKDSSSVVEDADRKKKSQVIIALAGTGDIPIEAQRMVYQGKELDDKMDLQEAGVDGDCVVQVYLRRHLLLPVPKLAVSSSE